MSATQNPEQSFSAQVLPSQCTIYKFDYGWGRLHFWLLEGEVTEQLQLLLNESPPKHDLWSTLEKREKQGFLSASSHLLDCTNIESTSSKDPPMERRLRLMRYFRKGIWSVESGPIYFHVCNSYHSWTRLLIIEVHFFPFEFTTMTDLLTFQKSWWNDFVLQSYNQPNFCAIMRGVIRAF